MSAEHHAIVEEEAANIDAQAAKVDEAMGLTVTRLDLGGELREAPESEVGVVGVKAERREAFGVRERNVGRRRVCGRGVCG